MKTLAITAAILSAISFSQMANAYQAEVGGSLAYVDPDNGSSGNSYDVNGTYYFKPVEVRNSPLAEAAFLDRASNASARVNYLDNDNATSTTYGAGIEYYIPNSDFYTSGSIAQNKYKIDTPVGNYDEDTTLYAAEVGYLPAPGLLLAAGVKGYNGDNDDGVDPTIRAKLVTQVGNNDVNLEAGASFGDLDEFNVKGDYYIDKTLSIGADYYNNDLNDQKEFGLNARKFINQQVSLEGRVGFGQVNDNDYNSFGVAAKYRF